MEPTAQALTRKESARDCRSARVRDRRRVVILLEITVVSPPGEWNPLNLLELTESNNSSTRLRSSPPLRPRDQLTRLSLLALHRRLGAFRAQSNSK